MPARVAKKQQTHVAKKQLFCKILIYFVEIKDQTVIF